ncbi:hypothetical protein [Kineococcus sp. SYSU DK006]|uniref:hypothetical protein n=1 Tax=Kineococcus sp. SYSU DK006 TaxID=3383127 RepID=UPI003D7E8457
MIVVASPQDSPIAAELLDPHAPLLKPMYVTVGRQGRPPMGYAWRIWTHRTSFYLKSRAPGLEQLKLSLHGDDPRHPAGGGFKIAMDAAAEPSQEVLTSQFGDWPIWFPGKEIEEGTILVARLRWTWDACTRLPAAPSPGDLRKGATGVAAPPPPEPGDAVDVDLILTTGEPFWLNESKARADDACIGPLRNDADQWLTGTVIKRTASHTPPPGHGVAPMPKGRGDEIRGVSASIDPEGYLWLLEQRMSRAGLSTLASQERPDDD